MFDVYVCAHICICVCADLHTTLHVRGQLWVLVLLPFILILRFILDLCVCVYSYVCVFVYHVCAGAWGSQKRGHEIPWCSRYSNHEPVLCLELNSSCGKAAARSINCWAISLDLDFHLVCHVVSSCLLLHLSGLLVHSSRGFSCLCFLYPGRSTGVVGVNCRVLHL